MTQQVRYGIIGCGMMGQEHMRNIGLLPEASIAAFYEPDDEMAARALAIAPAAMRVDSVADLLAIENLDCLLIVSPNFCHVDQMQEIAATRPLPLLVEKPLFTDPADATRLATFRDSYPAPIWVAMEYRYMPVITEFLAKSSDATGGIRQLSIREHRFPFLQKVGDWNRFNRFTGGTFVEKCCHFFDLMRLALGSDPVRVMASASQAVNHLDEKYEGETPDIIDSGYAIVDFENGTRAMLELCMFAEGSAYQEELSAVGPNGKIEAFVPGPGRFWPAHLGAAPVAKLVTSPRTPQGPVSHDIPVDPTLLEAGDHNGSTFYQHQRFVALVRGETARPDVSLNDGWAAVAMGIAAQESARTGQAVDPRRWM
ncbi:Gfo/Idh/MocA family oxidoreductase [uncultured Tateyamaria sp.]|uniref:Gfo/Idh/MocA family protein n=1 Tax=uncultured Tateyamaria sp. TaxID=455651 RepID=UPI00262C529C|nr:Gfo/Idh/MocA family oxidoreductase [uncultured Tateyamaria sp.]